VVPHEHLLTVMEAASRLGVSTSTIYAMCARGKLAHIRAGNVIRIAPGDLQALRKGCQNGEY
jgi:excisionase family DNA binding protein